MPKVMIWIRKEDYEIWRAITDKPEFIHQVLNVDLPQMFKYLDTQPKYGITASSFSGDSKQTKEKVVTPKIIKTSKDAQKAVEDFPGYISKSFSARKKK